MKKYFHYFSCLIFGTPSFEYLKDFRFWLLLVSLNTGANLGFNYLFSERFVIIGLFLLLSLLFVIRKNALMGEKLLKYNHLSFIFLYFIIFLFQGTYLSVYSISTTIRYFLFIFCSIYIITLCNKSFVRYFSSIIFIYATISLVCYIYVNLGGSISYYPITESIIDGGYIRRVFNIYYTQLGDGMGDFYSIRNCGPFWEPGAFQGFLNLALYFELTLDQIRNKFWAIRVVILVLAILSTLSTGGYVVLFVILTYFFFRDKSIHPLFNILLTIIFGAIFLYAYHSLDFLDEKISSDTGRLSFSFVNFPNIYYMIFGYGYSPESFNLSSMSNASSIFNLFRYVGIVGFVVFIVYLFNNKTPNKYFYTIIMLLILTNEPFLSNSFIWWGMAFVTYSAYRNS